MSATMEKVRQAMELALKEHWEAVSRDVEPATPPEVPLVPITRRARAPAPVRPTAEGAAAAPPSRPPGVPVFAVDERTFAANRLVAALREHPQREHYYLLQTVVAELVEKHEISALGVTRPLSGRGKTLTAVNLAISLALDGGRNVALVDLDLANPSMHELFDLDAGPGIEGALFNDIELPSLWRCPSVEGLIMLSARGGSRAVAQVMRSSAPKALLEELRRLVPGAIAVVNLPPVASRDDALAAGALVDAVLLVAEDNVTREADYARVLAGFGTSKVIGTVLNNG